jgi:hypothetical protein
MPGSFKKTLLTLLMLAAWVGSAHGNPVDSGLRSAKAEELWPRWQGRVAVGTVTPIWRYLGWGAEASGNAPRVDSLSVLGDYYFAPAGRSGGFRATSGLIIGTPSHRSLGSLGAPAYSPVAPAATRLSGDQLERERAALPYLGLGYSRMSGRAGWGFSADIGLIARQPGSAVRLGRVLGGSQPLDELLREMRLSPLVNLGVSYSF